MRPLRGCIQYRRVEIVVARGNQFAGIVRRACLGFAAARGGCKGRRDVGVFFDALADALKVGIGFGAAGRVVGDAARLIPIDADGADDVVDQPALLGPAFGMSTHGF